MRRFILQVTARWEWTDNESVQSSGPTAALSAIVPLDSTVSSKSTILSGVGAEIEENARQSRLAADRPGSREHSYLAKWWTELPSAVATATVFAAGSGSTSWFNATQRHATQSPRADGTRSIMGQKGVTGEHLGASTLQSAVLLLIARAKYSQYNYLEPWRHTPFFKHIRSLASAYGPLGHKAKELHGQQVYNLGK
ncbi:hypothetical protein BDN71DRAFT_1432283 [Pleurotus eryngii]|uniref:Uncharacterized protein n=1 Tax=Pleurotus eryngii TaxID=5323 RepID=A0A9P6DFG5_PLEER|nr:hypothetical protein BDN71DRAFT_1432283 [Pleurotus eryngii]